MSSFDLLSTYMEHMNRVVRDVFGSFGSSAVYQNVGQPGKETGYQLQGAVIAFADAWRDIQTTPDELLAATKKVEGLLLIGHSLGVINDKTCDGYIDELYNVMEKR